MDSTITEATQQRQRRIVKMSVDSRSTRKSDEFRRSARFLVWLYCFLWIMEGALRKWLLPGLSDALLLVRDPVVIGIYFCAFRAGVFPRSAIQSIVLTLGVVTLLLGLLQQPEFPIISLYGFRTNYLHIPLIFVLPKIWDEEDVKLLGKYALWFALPMAVLMVVQFQAGADSPLNVGVGGAIGGQLETARGHIRPPGTFSFTLGPACFFALATAFVVHSQFSKKDYPVNAWVGGIAAVLLSTVVSGSRTQLWSVASVLLIGVCVGTISSAKQIGRLLVGFGLFALCFLAIAQLPIFSEGVATLTERVEIGAKGNGGVTSSITERAVGDFTSPFEQWNEVPVLGYGLGIGTNAGAKLRTGKISFLLAENEWSRVIMEIGPFLGTFFLLLRVTIVGVLIYTSLWQIRLRNNLLPAMLTGACAINVMLGQWGVPLVQGFSCCCAGLALAACRPRQAPSATEPSLVFSAGGTRQ